MKGFGVGMSVLSILLGLFGILAPAIAWIALALGLATAAGDGTAAETASAIALSGSYLLAMVVVLSCPIGLLVGVIGGGLSWASERTVAWAVVGIALNVVAPVTWLVTWASLLGGVLFLFQDFHW